MEYEPKWKRRYKERQRSRRELERTLVDLGPRAIMEKMFADSFAKNELWGDLCWSFFKQHVQGRRAKPGHELFWEEWGRFVREFVGYLGTLRSERWTLQAAERILAEHDYADVTETRDARGAVIQAARRCREQRIHVEAAWAETIFGDWLAALPHRESAKKSRGQPKGDWKGEVARHLRDEYGDLSAGRVWQEVSKWSPDRPEEIETDLDVLRIYFDEAENRLRCVGKNGPRDKLGFDALRSRLAQEK